MAIMGEKLGWDPQINQAMGWDLDMRPFYREQ
jgi:hypothetical protein